MLPRLAWNTIRTLFIGILIHSFGVVRCIIRARQCYMVARFANVRTSSSFMGPTYFISGGNSSGMFASSSPIIQTPPSALLGLSSPEDRYPVKRLMK